MVKAYPPILENVTVFGDGAFKEAIKVKSGHMRALIQRDWCVYKEGGRQGCERKEERPHKDKKVGDHLQANEAASGEAKPAHTLVLNFWPPGL